MKKFMLLLCAALLLPSGTVYAKTKVTEVKTDYTYEEALKQSLKDFPGLTTLEESRKLLKEQQDALKKQLKELTETRNAPDMYGAYAPMDTYRLSLQAAPFDGGEGETPGPVLPPGMEELMKLLEQQQAQIMMQQQQLQALQSQLQTLPGLFAAPQPTEEQLKHSIKTLDRQIESLLLNKTLIESGVEVSLKNALVNIANYQLDAALMEASITLNEESLRREKLRHSYGVASDSDLKTAEQTLAQNQTNLETLRITLANERQALNKVMQLPLEAEITVTWERALAEPPEDAAAYIADMLKTAPTIKQKQLTVDMKKANKDLNKDDESQKLALQSEYDQALRDLDEAKRSLEAVIRQSGQNIDQLVKRDASLAVDKEKAADQYKNLQAHLAAGLVTEYELSQVTLAVTSAEIAQEKNMNQRWILDYMYAHPYLS